jgi:hypothetical protein
MELTLTKTPVDIKTLIQNSDISIYDKTRLIQKIEDNFNNDEQKLYISHLFLYLNYHPINDFVINLENVWKFIGFSNKANAKRLLKHHFIENKDYKIIFIKVDDKTLLIRSDEQKNKDEKTVIRSDDGKFSNETIMLNINTFKKLCLKANTESSDKIHDYYIKLEMMFNDLMKEEIDQHKKEFEKQLEEHKKQLEITEKQLELEKRQKNKLLNRKYYNAKPGHMVYLYRDTQGPDASYKIGKTEKMIEREDFYSHSSKSGSIVHARYCLNCHTVERVLHHILDKYRLIHNQEWFSFKDETFGIQVIDCIVDLMDSYLENIETFIPSLFNFLKPFGQLQHTSINNRNIHINATFTPLNEAMPPNTDTNIQLSTPNSTGSHEPNSTGSHEPNSTGSHEPNSTGRRCKIDDFDQFIQDVCELNNDKYCFKPEMKQAYRIWCKTVVDIETTKKLETYLSSRFNSGQVWDDDMKRNVYKGVALKPLQYQPKYNADYENFLIEKCKFYYSYRTSYVDFFEQFTKWKQQTEPNYKLQHKYKKLIQAYLEDTFAGGRVHISSYANSTHLFGVYGVGFEFNHFGLKDPVRTNKKVGQFNANTNELIASWESLVIAAKSLDMNFSTLSYNIRFGTVKNDYVYKYLD